jgi:hypothetical protein
MIRGYHYFRTFPFNWMVKTNVNTENHRLVYLVVCKVLNLDPYIFHGDIIGEWDLHDSFLKDGPLKEQCDCGKSCGLCGLGSVKKNPTRWCPKIAKLVYNSNNYGL